jgi:hypothetical protein
MIPTRLPHGPTTAEPHVHTLGPDELATLRTLGAALASDRPVRAVARALEGAPGDAIQVLDAAVELNRSIRTAAHALARAAVLGAEAAPLTDARLALEAAIGGHPTRRRGSRIPEEAARTIREAGLETQDASLLLGTRQDGTQVIVWHPVAPETAHVWLLESLYEHVETAVLLDPLLDLERQASAWWFERWTPPRRRPEETFPRGVREQEWSLVERITLSLETPVMAAYSEYPVFDELPARQQAMARALAGSFAGVFTVRDRHGSEVILEGIAGGEHYPVHEHNEEIAYHPGDLALGRLIPFGPERHLRSPGMAFLALPDPTLAQAVGGRLERSADELGSAIAVEICISMLLGAKGLPRKVRAAASKTEARALLQELQETLEAAGLARHVAPARVSAELRRLGRGKEMRYYEYDLDDAVAQWFQALSEQAGRPGGKHPG